MTNPALIAIVDDDASVRESLCSLVRSMGYATRTYASAIEFLRTGPDEAFTCVITDMQMPDMDGIGLQRALRDAGHSVPVIVVTAFFSEDVRRRALEAGAWDVFRKPCDGTALGRSLKTVFETDARNPNAPTQ